MLADTVRPFTLDLLARVGVPPGGRCLDVGCGGGHVTVELARLVGTGGEAVGVDLDAEILDLARRDARTVPNVSYLRAGAEALPPGPFDVAYARFLLSHVPAPADVVADMARVVTAGGAVVVEDIDFAGAFCHPPCAAHARFVELYQDAVRRRGGDPGIGPRLPGLLRGAGLDAVQVSAVQPVAMDGEGKLVSWLTLERLRAGLVEEGLVDAGELDDVLGELLEFTKDAATVLAQPRVVQAWGLVPG